MRSISFIYFLTYYICLREKSVVRKQEERLSLSCDLRCEDESSKGERRPCVSQGTDPNSTFKRDGKEESFLKTLRKPFGFCIIQQPLLPTQAARLLSRTGTNVILLGSFEEGRDLFFNLIVLLF